MPIVLAGNSFAGVLALEVLLEMRDATEVLVLAPAIRSGDWQASLAQYATARGVRTLTPSDVNDTGTVAEIRSLAGELLLSVYYTQVFRPSLIQAVTGPIVNFHPSLLPRHRGVAPLIWAIAEGDTMTGVTAHYIDEGIDTGHVLFQHLLPIHPRDTGYSLHLKMARLVKAACAEVLRQYSSGALPPGTPQTGAASYHSRRDPALNHLDWLQTRDRIRNIVRALAPPLPGAYALLDDGPLVFAHVEPVELAVPDVSRPPGMIEFRRSETPIVWAQDGPLKLLEFVDEGIRLPGRFLLDRRPVAEGQILD